MKNCFSVRSPNQSRLKFQRRRKFRFAWKQCIGLAHPKLLAAKVACLKKNLSREM